MIRSQWNFKKSFYYKNLAWVLGGFILNDFLPVPVILINDSHYTCQNTIHSCIRKKWKQVSNRIIIVRTGVTLPDVCGGDYSGCLFGLWPWTLHLSQPQFCHRNEDSETL